MRNSLQPGSQTKILSAFTLPQIPGAIYVEIDHPMELVAALNGIHGVFTRSRELVPLEERAQLFQLRRHIEFTPIQPLTWVRTNGRLALVKSVDRTSLTAQVLSVPEPKPLCADPPHDSDTSDGDDSITLEELTVELDQLVHSYITPSQHELTNFTKSEDELVVRALHRVIVTLKPGTFVQMISGSYKGVEGYVKQIVDDKTITFQPTVSGLPACDVHTWQVRKSFCLGGSVDVAFGHLEGRKGIILALDDVVAKVFQVSPAVRQVRGLLASYEK
jgi:transcription antitermination factor NusG